MIIQHNHAVDQFIIEQQMFVRYVFVIGKVYAYILNKYI